jgi:heme/copper-type cytochrome/quinol oxidase subunit 4
MWTNAFFVFAMAGVVVLIATVIWAVRDTNRNKKRQVI